MSKLIFTERELYHFWQFGAYGLTRVFYLYKRCFYVSLESAKVLTIIRYNF